MTYLKHLLLIIAIFGISATSMSQSADPKPSNEKRDKPASNADSSINHFGNARSEGLTKIFSGENGDEEDDCDCEVTIDLDLDMEMDIDIDVELDNEIDIEVDDIDVDIDEEVEIEIDNDFEIEMNEDEEMDERNINDNDSGGDVRNDHKKLDNDNDKPEEKTNKIEKNKIKSTNKSKPDKSAGLRKIN